MQIIFAVGEQTNYHKALTRLIQFVCSPDGKYYLHKRQKLIIQCLYLHSLTEEINCLLK